jgi:hypothetical protein
MNTFKKAAEILFQILWFMLCALPAAAMSADDAPESVTIDYLGELYEAVTFGHQEHSEMFDCSACHHHTTGTGTQNETCKKCHSASEASDNVSCSDCHKHQKTALTANSSAIDTSLYHIDKPGLKGALHLQCVGCHRSESGPTGCQECHDFTPAGRKRFALQR